MIIILFLNIFFKEIEGKIVYKNSYPEDLVYHGTQFQSGIIGNNYKEVTEWRKDFYYKYNVDNACYINSRISNVLIYPSSNLDVGNNITVYYNVLFPNYSVVFKCNSIYFIINCIPIIILLIIFFFLKTKRTVK